jgi:poly(3-hydroxybutyrate) depolymerase
MSKSTTKWKLTKDPSSIKNSACANYEATNRLAPWKITDSITTRSFFVYMPPTLCNLLSATPTKDDITKNGAHISFNARVILAIHGYGGQPLQEINKWQSAASDLSSIILAPMGTETKENGRLGWNANDCCGDPVTEKVDDLNFLNGVMDVFSGAFDNTMGVRSGVHVIATGFSNGGFLSSLLGLQIQRPPWLIGIVPTGGYQYNLSLYGDSNDATSKRAAIQPLPMMAHHGGADSVVNPDGCCTTPDKPSESNCPLDIGINQSTCTSVQTALEKWSQINKCTSTSLKSSGERYLENAPHQCWKGNECEADTELCIWTHEGHSWGGRFPGVDVAKVWMGKVFTDAESKTPAVGTERVHAEKGAAFLFTAFASVLLFTFVFLIVLSKRVPVSRRRLGRLHKRKSSEDAVIQIENSGNERDANDNDEERIGERENEVLI